MFSALLKSLQREKRNKKPVHRTNKLSVETLEDRRVLTSVTMTDYEQLMLELVNRARANPLAEVSRSSTVSDLNQGLAANTISSTPKQPLASVQELVDAGSNHALDMLAKDYFSHYSDPSGDDPTDRAAALGYSMSVGENIAWNGSTGSIDHNEETINAHNNLFTSPSHRRNMLVDSYEESGMAVEFGEYTYGNYTYNAAMTAQEFSFNADNPYLTGVVFDDSVVDDEFYSVGESEAGIRITAVDDSTGASFYTESGPSGGYQMKLPSGSYTVTATGNSLPGPMVVTNVTVGSINIKVDFDTSTAEAPAPVPRTPSGSDIVGFASNSEFWVGESNGSGLNTTYYGGLTTSVDFEHVGTADVNGDGLDDIISYGSDGSIMVAVATGDSSFAISRWGTFTTITTWTLLVGDFNGDGMDDLMGRADSDGTYWLAKSNGSRFQTSYWGKLTTVTTWQNLTAGDFNGDGAADITGRAADGTWWTSLSNGSDALHHSKYWGKWSLAVTWSDVRIGDFNGDGMDDIAGRANNAYWWVNRASGDEFFYVDYWVSWTQTVNWDDVSVGDFDGDGRDDIAGRANGQWWLALSNGRTFVNRYWGSWPTTVAWSNVSVMDVDQDGRDDIAGRASNGQWWIFRSDETRFQSVYGTQWSNGVSWDFVAIGNFT